jgi:hypothetical protein
MNERIKEIAVKAQVEHCISHVRLQEFAELIIRECMAQCEQVAADADTMTKSEFVTDAGRMLHEGMWGGAKNCGGQIKEHFGVQE